MSIQYLSMMNSALLCAVMPEQLDATGNFDFYLRPAVQPNHCISLSMTYTTQNLNGVNVLTSCRINDLVGNGDTTGFCGQGWGTLIVQFAFSAINHHLSRHQRYNANHQISVTGSIVGVSDKDIEASEKRRIAFWGKFFNVDTEMSCFQGSTRRATLNAPAFLFSAVPSSDESLEFCTKPLSSDLLNAYIPWSKEDGRELTSIRSELASHVKNRKLIESYNLIRENALLIRFVFVVNRLLTPILAIVALYLISRFIEAPTFEVWALSGGVAVFLSVYSQFFLLPPFSSIQTQLYDTQYQNVVAIEDANKEIIGKIITKDTARFGLIRRGVDLRLIPDVSVAYDIKRGEPVSLYKYLISERGELTNLSLQQFCDVFEVNTFPVITKTCQGYILQG